MSEQIQIDVEVLEEDDVRTLIDEVVDGKVQVAVDLAMDRDRDDVGEIATKEYVRQALADLDVEHAVTMALGDNEDILSEDDVDDRVREVVTNEFTDLVESHVLTEHIDTAGIARDVASELDIEDAIRSDTEIYERLDSLEEDSDDQLTLKLTELRGEHNGLVDNCSQLAKHVVAQRGEVESHAIQIKRLEQDDAALKDYIEEQARRITDLAEQVHNQRGVIKQLVLVLAQVADHQQTTIGTIDTEVL
jgi:cell division protein FtsB